MATTRIIPLHIHKNRTLAECITRRTDYAKNPDKTDGGQFVSAYECSPECVDADFMLSKLRYNEITGLKHKNNVIAYQVRQSFKPGQVSAEEANQIGYEFAMRFTKGRHAFIVATHTDKAHIHNHIIWNSTTLDCTHKFRDFKRSGKAVMELSDLICVEHGLPIIEIPKNKRVSYDKWLGANHVETKRDRLCAAIEEALRSHPKSIEELLELLQEAGYETKVGKDIAARYKGDKRFLRFSTFGEGYGKDELLAVLLGEKQLKPKRKQYTRSQKVSLLIDIQEKLDAGKGVGYQRWASVFNAKELAKTINFLQAHGFSSYDELCQIADSAVDHFNELSDSIRDAETRMADITVLKEQIINYAKTREVFAQYKASHYSKKFLAAHEQEIKMHRSAKQTFNELGITKLPSVKSLQAEYSELTQTKKQTFGEYLKARDDMREYLTVRHNVERILQTDQEQQKRAEQKKQVDR